MQYQQYSNESFFKEIQHYFVILQKMGRILFLNYPPSMYFCNCSKHISLKLLIDIQSYLCELIAVKNIANVFIIVFNELSLSEGASKFKHYLMIFVGEYASGACSWHSWLDPYSSAAINESCNDSQHLAKLQTQYKIYVSILSFLKGGTP